MDRAIPPRRGGGGKFALKLALSLALLLYLFSKTDLGPLWGSLRHAHWPSLLLGMGLVLWGQVMSAFKWKLLLKAVGIESPFGLLVRCYFIGTFFSLFLPGLIGGDFVRGYYLVKEKKETSGVILSIMAERLLGLVCLLILARGFLFFYDLPGSLGRAVGPALSLLLLFLLLGISGLVLWGFLLQSDGDGPPAILFRLLRDLSLFWAHPILLGAAMLLVFGWQVIFVTVHILLGRSLGFGIPLVYYFIFVPLSTLLSALPISLSGLGVREGSYFYFLRLVQVPGAQALSFSLLWLFILLASGLVGGMVYLGDSRIAAALAARKKG